MSGRTAQEEMPAVRRAFHSPFHIFIEKGDGTIVSSNLATSWAEDGLVGRDDTVTLLTDSSKVLKVSWQDLNIHELANVILKGLR